MSGVADRAESGAEGANSNTSSSNVEFERLIRLGKSYALEAESKLEGIREAEQARAAQVRGGTVRGTAAAGFALGRLRSEFDQLLASASATAEKARALNPKGEVQLEDGVFVRPDVIFAYLAGLRGKLELALGDARKALPHFEEAIRLNPTEEAYHYNSGLCLTDLSRPEDAKISFRKAVELEPLSEIGIEASKMIDHLEAGRVGQKHFRGSWKVLGVLAVIAILSFLVHIWIVFLASLAAVGAYFWWKFK